MKKLSILFLTISVSLLSSCVNKLQPLSTKPPASAVTLNEKVTWGDGFILKRFEFHPAKHTPKFEDKKGYYYASEQKVFVHDALAPTQLLEGGIFWKKNETSPKMTYTLSPLGTVLRHNHKVLNVTIQR